MIILLLLVPIMWVLSQFKTCKKMYIYYRHLRLQTIKDESYHIIKRTLMSNFKFNNPRQFLDFCSTLKRYSARDELFTILKSQDQYVQYADGIKFKFKLPYMRSDDFKVRFIIANDQTSKLLYGDLIDQMHSLELICFGRNMAWNKYNRQIELDKPNCGYIAATVTTNPSAVYENKYFIKDNVPTINHNKLVKLPIICGFLAYEVLPRGISITTICKDPQFANYDIGSRMMTKFINYIAKNRLIILKVSAKNSRAITFYKRMGFIEYDIIKDYYNKDEDAIEMYKN